MTASHLTMRGNNSLRERLSRPVSIKYPVMTTNKTLINSTHGRPATIKLFQASKMNAPMAVSVASSSDSNMGGFPRVGRPLLWLL